MLVPRIHLQHLSHAVALADVSDPTLGGSVMVERRLKKDESMWSSVYVCMDSHKSGNAGFECSGNYASVQRNLMGSYVMN